ncbi:MAG: putative HNHc nuclease [Clostridia bacterium]
MEIASGKIISIDEKAQGVTVWVPYSNWDRLCLRQYDAVQVGFPDGRSISPEQRRKAYALMGEIAAHTGYTPEEAKLTLKHEFVQRHMEALKKELFSLSDCDVTTAREFISYLIEFVLEFDVPTSVPLVTLCDDLRRYVYACLVHKKCAVCGHKADLHHVDRVGMGRNRNEINHIGMRALPLCREHHQLLHSIVDGPFMEIYHLEAIPIDERIAKAYNLRAK